jgi:hypothetical protein
MVQQENVIACLKFFKACFLQTPLLARHPKDYRPYLHHYYYHLAPFGHIIDISGGDG